MKLNFDIDLVYLWCDGNDPEFQRKKLEAFEKTNKSLLNKDGLVNARFVNSDELKYSLRSAEKYAPWIRNIYIVTYEQVPAWLNTKHPKIKIIDHKDIIPQKYLPTFNSNVIEIFLPMIPDLSEHFLYANDDMFFWGDVDKDFFFNENGAPICRVIRRKAKNVHSIYSITINNAYNLVSERFPDKDIKYWPHHGIDSYRRSDFLECLNCFKEEIMETASHTFRDTNDIQRMIVNFYAIAAKGATVKEVARRKWYQKFLPFTEENAYTSCRISKMKQFRGKDFQLFCINDGRKTKDKDRKYMQEMLEEKFPQKSAYEL